jgi:glutamate dehydrogenase
MTAIRRHVDLLWFGGIGTYIRVGESDEQVGDRINDPIPGAAEPRPCDRRRCQSRREPRGSGRAERHQAQYRRHRQFGGGQFLRLEVNIKIALGSRTRRAIVGRNRLLAEMTDGWRARPRNNYLQTLALSLTERKGVAETGFLSRLMQSLERRGLLSRAVEYLPDDAAIPERTRRGKSLTRPELAVLLGEARQV